MLTQGSPTTRSASSCGRRRTPNSSGVRSPPAAEIRRQLLDRDAVTVEDAWIDEFAVAGTPTQVAARLNRLYESGADRVGLWLFPSDSLSEVLRRVARDVLPLVRAGR